MTEDPFGRTLSAWLHEEAGHRVSDHLAEALVQTAATRQRPWWSSLERLLPMTTTTMTGRVAAGRPGVMLALVALLLLGIAGVALLAGAQRSDPSPFGLADNGRIYVADGSTIRSFAADGSDPQALDVETGVAVSGLSVSPDGERLAFISGREGAMQIRVVNLADGTTVEVPTPFAAAAEGVAWSPDGSHLTYAGLEGGLGGPERVYVTSADGTGELTTPGADSLAANDSVWLPTYSPDGEWIAFLTKDRNTPDDLQNGRVLVMHPDGSDIHEVAANVATPGATWAPDPSVQRLLYTSTAGPTILDLGDGAPVRLGPGFWPSWSPDGSRVAYWADGSLVVSTEDALRGSPVLQRAFEGFTGACEDHPELAGRTVCSPVSWSPDGTQLIGTDIAGGALLVAPLDGSGEPVRIPLQFTSGLEIFPEWQPIH